MTAGIYKPGQGYWTRVISAIALGLLVLMGVVWLWDLLANARIGKIQPVYVKAGACIILFAVFGWLGYSLLGRKQRVVDFMIATEAEMKKVNWSSKREIVGSTWLVIGLTIVLALLTFVFDLFFQIVFQKMGVLET